MAAPHYSVIPPSVPKHSIDLKANGEVSRMRSHKGNMPSLPQTKYCPLCPAKFTRTTHLNRHLRSHTNERLHCCDICQSQFTRSDLLTRHKRTCGDSANSNRSRRKSCQACAESKIKCSLTFPCSKCTSRGRECIFVNDPETSRNKKYAASQKAAQNSAEFPTGPISEGSPVSSDAASPQSFSAAYTAGLDSEPTFSSISPFPSTPHGSLSMPGFDPSNFSISSGSSSTSSLHSSPRSDYFEVHGLGSFDLDADSLTLDTQFCKMFSGATSEPFINQSFSPTSPDSAFSGVAGDFAWVEGTDYFASFSNEDHLALAQSLNDPRYGSDFPTTITPSPSPILSPAALSAVNFAPPAVGSGLDFDPSVAAPPQTAELQHYVYLFFSAFSAQVPLLHAFTWQMGGNPPVLVRAMQACGALFVKTAAAAHFVAETLAYTRDVLIQEFAKNPTDSMEQFQLILACVLLQTIGLFHQHASQRISSNVYHGMLVMMIRRSGLIKRITSWNPPDLSDSATIESAWRDWAKYETVKRALLLSYMHDCSQCMYFSLCPSFHPCEFEINLPSDDALWRASSSREWFDLLQAPSPYGMGQARLLGVGMQHALAAIGAAVRPPVLPVLNPFASFIIIHSLLRNIYECRSDPDPTGGTPDGLQAQDLAAQHSLHGWLQVWLNGPESLDVARGKHEPPFVRNALPFYWLAQVSLLAIQEGTSLLGSRSPGSAQPDGRFRLIKQWLDHIRAFLRRGDQSPSGLWDELMQIRGQMSDAEAESGSAPDSARGLVAFFTER